MPWCDCATPKRCSNPPHPGAAPWRKATATRWTARSFSATTMNSLPMAAEERFRSPEGWSHPAAPGSRAMEKGNRDQVDGKVFLGNHDEFVADGGRGRTFRPLWWRTYRYLELDIETKQEPLTVEDLHATYVGFPFQRRARFDGGTPELNRILDVGWRTARLCAHETHMDCPYYEQLQYVGDTRVQCLVSLDRKSVVEG